MLFRLLLTVVALFACAFANAQAPVPSYFDGEKNVSYAYSMLGVEHDNVPYTMEQRVYVKHDSLYLAERNYEKGKKTNSGKSLYACALKDFNFDGAQIAANGDTSQNGEAVYAMVIPTKATEPAPAPVRTVRYGKTEAMEKTSSTDAYMFPAMNFKSKQDAKDALMYLKSLRH